MSAASIHHALLRPAIIQILRAVGFHSSTPVVIDTITELAGKYMSLLASRAIARAVENHEDNAPDVTDIRLAMVDCGLLSPASTSTEEVWRELLRKPLDSIPERNGLRAMEMARRDQEDTAEIRDFLAWFQGSIQKEILRISGMQQDHPSAESQSLPEVQDYLTALKKKHSKTGEESRFQGTVLGIDSDLKPVKVEGGPESIKDWVRTLKTRSPQVSTPSTLAKDSNTDTIMTG